ncbi:MAG TPA: S8 family peptidase [Casimicrobiaceae bacterium]|nr:S8 family peptidase [Casimicrobiaceae bacterium]
MVRASGPAGLRAALRLRGLAVLAAFVLPLSAVGATPAKAPMAAKSAATLRVMINPAAAPRGELPAAVKQRLETLAGVPLALAATTRTGALDLAVDGADAARLDVIAARLRADRSVLWAERATRTVYGKSARVEKAAGAPARKLLVRLADDADPVAAAARLAALAGTPVALERTIGAVRVMSLAQARTVAAMDDLARAFEQDPAVRYADAVRRVVPHAGPTPNDPLYAQQWALARIRAGDAWLLGTGAGSMTVAVVDTGILPHPDLAGRVLPGYDFVADADAARDGDGRDADPRDEGDWFSDGDCGGLPGQSSFFHGLFVAGLIAANANNDTGIAGLDWAAKILPVRALGKCGGTYEDVLAALLWAAGAPVDGAPPNPHPAKVINLSLGGPGACAAAIQEAIDDALAQGTVIVASAGNESADAQSFSPGNCSGVINVSAVGRTGERASYSNFGTRVDLAAPGGDLGDDGAMLSTHNAGTTVPGEADYGWAMGTSFAAPLVSGTASLMLARNPNLSAGQVLSILQGTSAEFPPGSTCAYGFCGMGALDTGTALASTIPASASLPPGAIAIVEYYDAALDHYFITADPVEIANLDAFAAERWRRTGHVFYGWADPAIAPPAAAPRNVCRFYAGANVQIDSHYFTADAARCAFVAASNGGVWSLQSSAAFWIEVPDAAGACRDGTIPVYAFFNNRRDANHRYTIDLSVRRAMTNRAWVADGVAANGAAFCSLI